VLKFTYNDKILFNQKLLNRPVIFKIYIKSIFLKTEVVWIDNSIHLLQKTMQIKLITKKVLDVIAA